MDDDEPISRKRKMDNRSDHDFLSDLPLNIIHCILALIPIRDAVKTCILSTQWRYKWASLPQLVFDDKCVNRNKSVECLKNIVTNALLLHEGPIQKFSLYTSLLNSCPATDRWLLWLSRNEIRELCIDISYRLLDSWFRVHSSLYSCRKLTYLDLFKCELRPPPLTFKGFSCLRSLALRHVKVPSNVVESLVANSPLLENFTSYYSGDAELRISAPNLKCFDLTGHFEEISLYAPVLAKVSVEFSKVGFTAEQQESSVCNYTKFLGGFTNLESLEVFSYFTKVRSNNDCHTQPTNGGDTGDIGHRDQPYLWYSFVGSSIVLFFSVCGYFYLNSYPLDKILDFISNQLAMVPHCAKFAKLLEVRRNASSIRFVLDRPHESGAPNLTVKSRCWYRCFKTQRSARRIEPFPTASLQLT